MNPPQRLNPLIRQLGNVLNMSFVAKSGDERHLPEPLTMLLYY